jgi:putative aldouronate transport system substrate-binding protein
MKRNVWGSGVAALMILTVTTLTGCSSNDSNGPSSPPSTEPSASSTSSTTVSTAPKAEPATLKLMLPGDRPTGMDQVIAEAEKRMAAQNLPFKLDITFVPWADLTQKLQITLAAGEDMDLIFDAPSNGMQGKVAQGYYEPLEDLLNKFGPEILKDRPKEMWDANKFQGKIYGVPLGVYHTQGKGLIIRGDLREKLGMGPIKTMDDLTKYFSGIKTQFKEVIPFNPNTNLGADLKFYSDYKTNIRQTAAFPSSLLLYHKNNDGKVYNLIDTQEPAIMDSFKEFRKMYTDGLINPDIMSLTNMTPQFTAGKVGAYTANDFGVPAAIGADLAKNVPGAKAEYVTFMTPEKNKISNFLQWNFISVPVKSKHKQQAIQFLNWSNQKANYDLLAYGIEGKDYTAVGADMYNPTGTYRWFPYAWVWNPVNERLNAALPAEVNNMNRWAKDASNFTPDILVGFSFDTTAVTNEIAQFNSVLGQYYPAMNVGALDPDKTLQDIKAKVGPSLKKIQDEMQKQIDAFLKTKK